MMTTLSSVLIATCVTGTSYFGSTTVELTRSYDTLTYNMLVQATVGIDGDGKEGVLADVSASNLQATHTEDGMLYEFEGWELEINGIWTQPYDAELKGELRQLGKDGKVIDTEALTCDFID